MSGIEAIAILLVALILAHLEHFRGDE